MTAIWHPAQAMLLVGSGEQQLSSTLRPLCGAGRDLPDAPCDLARTDGWVLAMTSGNGAV